MTPYVRELIFVLWFERYWCATLFRMTQPNPLTLGAGELNAHIAGVATGVRKFLEGEMYV